MAEQLMREDPEERGSDEVERTSDDEERAEGEEPKSLDDIIEAYATE